ncbi:MAG: CU044_2847 family protein [Chloroflexales bacterium]
MPTKLIELKDGTLVEVDVPADQARPIAGGAAERVMDATLERITPMILKVYQPISVAWEQLNQEMDLDSVDVEVGFSFESEGNLYLAKATAGANIKVTFSMKPRRGEV